MTLTVSVSQLRNNISGYLAQAVKGSRILIRDEKRRQTIAQITPIPFFDKNMYEKSLRHAAGVLSAAAHPQWQTKSKVVRWLTTSRLSDQRHF